MIDFYLLTDRINDSSKKKIRAHIFNDREVNYDFIIPFLENLEVEICLSEIIKNPIYSKLYNSYTKQKDINKLIEDTNLYASQFINLADLGIIKQNDLAPEHLEPDVAFFIPPSEITIINAKEFKKLKRRTFKDFAFIVLVLKRRTFLISLFDEISKMGPFNEAEIFKLKERFQAKQKKLEELIKPYLDSEINAKKSEKDNSLSLEPKERTYQGAYRTFVFKKAENDLNYFTSTRNEPVLREFWNDLVQADLINKSTINDLKALFHNAAINKNNRIIWSKSIKTLTEFVNALIKSDKIVDLNGVDHWLITINCFVLRSSKEIQFSSLYRTQGKDSPMKAKIEFIVNNFIEKLG